MDVDVDVDVYVYVFVYVYAYIIYIYIYNMGVYVHGDLDTRLYTGVYTCAFVAACIFQLHVLYHSID